MRAPEFLSKQDPFSVDTLLLKKVEKHQLKAREKWVLKRIGRGKRVLDLGCGSGVLSALIQEKNNEVYGLDINPSLIQIAKQKGISGKVCDLNERIPFEDHSFEVVFGGDVFAYVYDTKHLFLECARVLKPGGTLIFTAPNLNSIQNRVGIFFGKYLSSHGAYPEDSLGGQIRVFNQEKIEELCRLAGFDVLELKGAFTSAANTETVRRPEAWLTSVARGISTTLESLNSLYPGLAPVLLVRAKRM